MSNGDVFKFREQLAWSQARELEFIELYKTHKLTLSDDRRHDFTTPRGLRVELKSDTYDVDKTSNFFMERWSSMEKKTPGGPWRAAQDGVDIWIYWFCNSGVYYEFRNLDKLIQVLDELTDKLPVVGVRNQGWITGGYKIPRDMLIQHFRRVVY